MFDLANAISKKIKGTSLHIVDFVYVDDSDLFLWDDKDASATVAKMQKNGRKLPK